MRIFYSLAVFFLLFQITNCEKNKHCRDDNTCLVNSNLKKLKDKNVKYSNGNDNSYEETYRKKYERYAATRTKQESSEAKKTEMTRKSNTSEKDCTKRKYQLNCSKSWQKAKNGESSTKNNKMYIKRENNLLLNLDNDDSDLKRKKQKQEQSKGKPTALKKVQEKPNKKINFKSK